jgi:hypothetical protein
MKIDMQHVATITLTEEQRQQLPSDGESVHKVLTTGDIYFDESFSYEDIQTRLVDLFVKRASRAGKALAHLTALEIWSGVTERGVSYEITTPFLLADLK